MRKTPRRPLVTRTTQSGISAIVVTRSNDRNGNSIYTARCGSQKHVHKYDPALTRDQNIEAAAELCYTSFDEAASMRGAYLNESTTVFVRLDQ